MKHLLWIPLSLARLRLILSTAWVMVFLITFGTACGQNEAPLTEQPAQDNAAHPYPEFRGQELRGENNFAELINKYQSGTSKPTPWAGFWWPYTSNGIASGTASGPFSPAGKYDAARGNQTQAQLWEIVHHGARVPMVQGWWGHCNGWSAAAALFPEPIEPVTVNGITFGIGDLKALLTEAGMSVNADFFGERIDVDTPESPKYWDVVPDQYFLVLTNYMGKLGKTILIDRYTGAQVWNQPLAGYRFDYPKPEHYLGNTPDAPHVYRIRLNSTIWWMDDGVPPDVITPPFSLDSEDPSGVVHSREIPMEIWVDAPIVFNSEGKITSSGNVIVTRKDDFIAGGAWLFGDGYFVDAWPDYMWVPYGVTKPTDPTQDFVNPEVDIDWIRTHLLVPGGMDDPSATPGSIIPAPNPSPTVLPSPQPGATATPSPFPGTGPGLPPDPPVLPNPTLPAPPVTPPPAGDDTWPWPIPSVTFTPIPWPE